LFAAAGTAPNLPQRQATAGLVGGRSVLRRQLVHSTARNDSGHPSAHSSSISCCWLSRSRRISSPIATMWGGGGSSGGGSMGAKSTMIKEEDITIKWLHWLMAAETNYAVQKRVWSLVNVDNFGGRQRNCNDRRVTVRRK
jgi:hypothetical protein